MGTLYAPVQGASSYVEKIKLASKLKELYQKWRWSRPFSGSAIFKSPLTYIIEWTLVVFICGLSIAYVLNEC